MDTRRFALVWGIVFLGLTATGVIPGLAQPHTGAHPDIAADSMYVDALGLFPFNLLHTIVHLIFGVWGIAASRSLGAAKSFARSTAIVYAMFVVMGLIPGLNTTFGLVPLFGHDVWLHVLLAAPAAYFGFMHRDAATTDSRR